MKLEISRDLRGFPKVSIARRLLMMVEKSFEEKEKSSLLSTGIRWQDGLTWCKGSPIGLLAFHFPSEVKKKVLGSISKTPAKTNSEMRASLSFVSSK